VRIIAFIAILLMSCLIASKRADSLQSPETSEPGTVDDFDAAKYLADAAENAKAIISGRMYLAIKAVEADRRTSVKGTLKETERDLSNFDIMVFSGKRSRWLKSEEAKGHYEVTLVPFSKPGEPVLLDAPTTLGRSARYAVRKSDMRVTRMEFER